MLNLRTKLIVKMKTETANMGIEFENGTPVISLIVGLLRYTTIDLVDAKERINKEIDRNLETKNR